MLGFSILFSQMKEPRFYIALAKILFYRSLVIVGVSSSKVYVLLKSYYLAVEIVQGNAFEVKVPSFSLLLS